MSNLYLVSILYGLTALWRYLSLSDEVSEYKDTSIEFHSTSEDKNAIIWNGFKNENQGPCNLLLFLVYFFIIFGDNVGNEMRIVPL